MGRRNSQEVNRLCRKVDEAIQGGIIAKEALKKYKVSGTVFYRWKKNPQQPEKAKTPRVIRRPAYQRLEVEAAPKTPDRVMVLIGSPADIREAIGGVL